MGPNKSVAWRAAWLQTLRLARTPALPLVMHDAMVAMPGLLAGCGLCVVLRPRRKRCDGARWLRPRAHGPADPRVPAAVAERPWDYEAFLWVHWPELLRCVDPARGGRVAVLSLRVWAMLDDLVAEYDPLAARDLRAAAAQPTRYAAASSRFALRVEALLAMPRFLSRAWRALSASLVSLDAPHILAELRPPIGTRGDGETWPSCSTLLEMPVDGAHQRRIRWLGVEATPRPRATSPARQIIDDLQTAGELHGVTVPKASLRYGRQRLVDFAALVRINAERGEDNEILVTARARTNDDYHAGAVAVDLFNAATEGRYVGHGTLPLEDMVRAAGWPLRPDEASPYALVRLPTVDDRVGRRRRRAAKVRLGLATKDPRAPRVVPLSWIEPWSSCEHQLRVVMRVVRRRSISDRIGGVAQATPIPMVTPPAALVDGALPKGRVPHGARWRSLASEYWSYDGLRWLLTRGDLDAVRRQRLSAFLDWWVVQAQTLTPDRFARALYDAKIDKRRAEMVRGERKTLGRFTAQETQLVREFCLARVKGGTLSEAEMTTLLELVPGRTLTALYAVIRRLGDEYARTYGQVAWRRSGFFVRYSAKRQADFKRRRIKQ